jgi:hypothetical protein
MDSTLPPSYESLFPEIPSEENPVCDEPQKKKRRVATAQVSNSTIVLKKENLAISKKKTSKKVNGVSTIEEKVLKWLDKGFKKSEFPSFLRKESNVDGFLEWVQKAKIFLKSFSSERVFFFYS